MYHSGYSSIILPNLSTDITNTDSYKNFINKDKENKQSLWEFIKEKWKKNKDASFKAVVLIYILSSLGNQAVGNISNYLLTNATNKITEAIGFEKPVTLDSIADNQNIIMKQFNLINKYFVYDEKNSNYKLKDGIVIQENIAEEISKAGIKLYINPNIEIENKLSEDLISVINNSYYLDGTKTLDGMCLNIEEKDITNGGKSYLLNSFKNNNISPLKTLTRSETPITTEKLPKLINEFNYTNYLLNKQIMNSLSI
jgi:hypothetical protein